MKFCIAAIVILALIGTLCAWGTNESVKRIDKMLDTLGEAESVGESIPTNSVEVAKEFGMQWEENMFLISMFLPHHHLDEVKEKLVALEAYADTEEFAEWREAKFVLEEEMQHIRGLICVSADNVL